MVRSSWLNRFGLVGVFSVALAFGCDNDKDGSSDKADSGGKAQKDGHDEHDDEHAGERHALGKEEIGGYTVEATQIGHVEAGEEALFEIALSGGDDGEPKAVRAWVGAERGAARARRLKKSGDFYDAHLDAPKPLPEGGRLWVEVQSESDDKSRGSFELEMD